MDAGAETMKRGLCIVVLAGVAACASQSAYSGGAASTTAPSASEQGAAERSDLSPEQVRIVQRSLADRGFAVDLTGTFDDRTQTALLDFQRARGFPATGQLDASTMEALDIDPGDVAPVRDVDPDSDEE